VGCGAIANAMHGPAYVKYASENKDAVLAGCCDIDEKRAAAFQNDFGFLQAYTDLDDMLARQKPDAVCLLTPVDLTAELAKKILLAGIPMIMEKPPGKTPEDTIRLADIAAKRSVPVRVAFNRRYAPLVRQMKTLLADSGQRIQSLQYDMLRIDRPDSDFSTTAIHALDAVCFITGSDFKAIRFEYAAYPELGENVADTHMQCIMGNGTIVNLSICPVTGMNSEKAVVNLHGDTMILDFMGNAVNLTGRLIHLRKGEIIFSMNGGDTPDGSERFEREGFYWENKSFFDDIIAGNIPEGDLASAVQSVAAADCMRRRVREFGA